MKKFVIPFVPRVKQKVILSMLAMYTFFVAVCHRRMGKTVLAANFLIKEAFASGIVNYRGYYIAPNQKQAKNIVWAYFKEYLAPLGKLVNFNETELRIDLPNGGKIYLAGAENIESLRGVYIDRMVGDEIASWVNARYAFFEVLYPAMTDRKGRALIIGTVKGLDLFHEFFTMGQDEMFPDWGSISVDVMESETFTKSEIAQIRKLMRPDAFAREYMNDFYAEVPDSLISAQEVYEAVGRRIQENTLRNYPEIWGFDVGYTNDPSVLAKRRGPLLQPLIEMKNKDSTYQAQWLKREIDRCNPSAVYIDAGYGEGVITQINRMGYDHVVFPIWFNGKSPKPNCVNMRAYMYNETKTWLETASIPQDEKLIKQMSNQLLDESDADRRIKLQQKKKIKELLGESPDRSDAVALTQAGGGEEEMTLEDKLRQMDGNVDIRSIAAAVGHRMEDYSANSAVEDYLDDVEFDVQDVYK